MRRTAAPRLPGLQTLPVAQTLPQPSAAAMCPSAPPQLPGLQTLPVAQALLRPSLAHQLGLQAAEKATLSHERCRIDDATPATSGAAPIVAPDAKDAVADTKSSVQHELLHDALRRDSIAAFFGDAEDDPSLMCGVSLTGHGEGSSGGAPCAVMMEVHATPWEAEPPTYTRLLPGLTGQHSDGPNEPRLSHGSSGSSGAAPAASEPPLSMAACASPSGARADAPPAQRSIISEPQQAALSVQEVDRDGLPAIATTVECSAAATGHAAAHRTAMRPPLATRRRSRMALGVTSADSRRQPAADAVLKLSRLSSHLQDGDGSVPGPLGLAEPSEAGPAAPGPRARTRAVCSIAAVTIGNVTTSQARLRI